MAEDGCIKSAIFQSLEVVDRINLSGPEIVGDTLLGTPYDGSNDFEPDILYLNSIIKAPIVTEQVRNTYYDVPPTKDTKVLVRQSDNTLKYEPKAENVFKTINVANQDNIIADNLTDTFTLIPGTNMTIETDNTTNSIKFSSSSGSNVQNIFKTIRVEGHSDLIPDTSIDVLKFNQTDNITITPTTTTSVTNTYQAIIRYNNNLYDNNNLINKSLTLYYTDDTGNTTNNVAVVFSLVTGDPNISTNTAVEFKKETDVDTTATNLSDAINNHNSFSSNIDTANNIIYVTQLSSRNPEDTKTTFTDALVEIDVGERNFSAISQEISTLDISLNNKINNDLIIGEDNKDLLLVNSESIFENNTTFNSAINVNDSLNVDNIKLDGNTISSTDTNGNINITPDGNGDVVISKVQINSGVINNVTIGTNNPCTELHVDNIKLDGNTISSTDTNGNINIKPDGDGIVHISKTDISEGNIHDININVGTNKVFNALGSTLIFDNDQISGDAINEGTIDSIAISQLTGKMDCNSQEMTNINIDSGVIDNVTIGTNNPCTELHVDNIKLDGNTISSTDTNGNINIEPDGDGIVNISKTNISEGIINNAHINNSNITIGENKVFNAVGSTLFFDNDQISGDAINEGTIDSIAISQLTGEMDCNSQEMTNINIDSGVIDNVTIGTNNPCTELHVDNVKIDGNTISSTDTNGNINIEPNGDGIIDLKKNIKVGTTLLNTDITNERIGIGIDISTINTNDDTNLYVNGIVKVNELKFDISSSNTHQVSYLQQGKIKFLDQTDQTQNKVLTSQSGTLNWVSYGTVATGGIDTNDLGILNTPLDADLYIGKDNNNLFISNGQSTFYENVNIINSKLRISSSTGANLVFETSTTNNPVIRSTNNKITFESTDTNETSLIISNLYNNNGTYNYEGDCTIGFLMNGSSNQYTLGVDDSDDKFKIGTSSIDTNTRLTIDSSGNVGIGTTNPQERLDVNGNIKASGDLNITGNTNIDGTLNVTGNISGNVTGTVSYISNHDTNALTEGTTNLYHTDSRSRSAISVTDSGGDGSLAYNNTNGVITYTGPSATETRAHFSGGTGVTITNGVVAIGQSVGTSDNVIFDNVFSNNIKNNLMDTNIWSTQSSGQISSNFGGYNLNQSDTGENNMLVNELGPFGDYEYVWKCISSNIHSTLSNDGGWNYDIDNVDYKFGYLSVVYFKVVNGTSGRFYHGCLQNGVFRTNGTTTNTSNPYFAQDINISNFEQNEWYVSIGIILPYKSDGYSPTPTTIGGIYRLSTGEKLSFTHYDFMMNNTTTTQMHRAYLFYSTSNLSELHFARPGFYKINGTDPTLTELLGGNTIDKSHIGDMGQSGHAGFSHVDNATTTNYALLQNSSGDTFINAASGQDISFRINNLNKMKLDSSGNVGIGTADPQSKLHINNGDLRLTDSTEQKPRIVFEEGTNDENIEMIYDGTGDGAGNYFAIRSNFDSPSWDNVGINYIPFSGNVGIGTTDPGEKLEVNGNIKASGDLNITGNTNISGSLNVDNLKIDGNTLSSVNNEDIIISPNGTGNTNIHNYTVSNKVVENNVDLLIEDDNSRLQLISNDSAGGGSYIALSNAPSTGDQKNWVFHHSGPTQDNKLGIYYKENNSLNTDSLYILSTTGLTLDTSGNVGIGKTDPEEKLHIYDTSPHLQIESASNQTSTLSLVESTYHGAGLQFNGNNDRFFIGTFSGNSIMNKTLTIKKGSNKLGVNIGDTDPLAELHVGGSMYMSAAASFLTINSTNNGAASSVGGLKVESYWARESGFYLDHHGNNERWLIGRKYNGGNTDYNLNFMYSSNKDDSSTQNTIMTINSSGNVGIGTTGPSSKLHIHDETTSAGIELSGPYNKTLGFTDEAGTRNRFYIELNSSRQARLISTGPNMEFYNPNLIEFKTTPTGYTTFNSTKESNDSLSGALVVSGGVGIAGNTNIGGTLDVTGATNINDTTQSTSTTTGALIVDGGVGIAENTNIGGTLDVTGATNINDTTQSTSTTTGALIVDGGVGIAKNTNIGGTLDVTGTLNVKGDVTIESIGNVGIGTNNPTQKLQLTQGSSLGPNIQLQNTVNIYRRYYDNFDNIILPASAPSTSSYFTFSIWNDNFFPRQFIYINRDYDMTNSSTGAYLGNNLAIEFGYSNYFNRSSDNTFNPIGSAIRFHTSSVSTTDSNISEKMCIDYQGNVGIGTVNPNTKLHISNYTISNKVVEDNVDLLIEDVDSRLQLISTNDGGAGSYIALSNAPSTGDQKNWVFHHYGITNNNKLGIYYKTNNTVNTDNLYINSNIGLTLDTNGNVGIGTTNPQEKLHVVGTTNITGNTNIGGTLICENPGHIVLRDTSNRTPEIVFEESVGDRNIVLVYEGAGGGSENYFAIRSGNTGWDNVGINYLPSTGNVGIGTTSPSYNLDLYDGNLRLLHRHDSSVYNNFLTFERSETDDCRINHYCTNQVSAQIEFNGYDKIAQSTIQFSTKESSGSLTPRMTVNYNGNVGIGTDNPQSSLHVTGSSYISGNLSFGSSTRQMINLYSQAYGIGVQSNTTYFRSSNDFQFYKGGSHSHTRGDAGAYGTSLFTIKESGNVGIGTDNPQSSLHVKQLSDSNFIYSGYNTHSSYALTMESNSGASFWSLMINQTHANDLNFLFNGNRRGYLDDAAQVDNIDFTGQHRNMLNKHIDETSKGLIVSSSGKYINLDNSLNININESLPICTITNIDNDIKVFGVISDKEDTNDSRTYNSGNWGSSYIKKNKNEQRMYINSLGEGAVWVCNKNGNLVNGDYISSSSAAGYGMKQITNKLLNSTVAKITCNCDFSLSKIVKQKLKVITTTETYEENVYEEIEKTNTENVIEYDETLQRYIQKEVTTTKTEHQQLYDIVDLYNETGEVIGTHQVERKETKTKTVTEIDYDENGDAQYEDDLDADGNQQMIYPFETRFLLPDATQITETEYNTKLSAGEQVYIACFVGCTYHCG